MINTLPTLSSHNAFVPWVQSRVPVAVALFRPRPELRPRSRPQLQLPIMMPTQMSSSECSLLEEQMRGRLPFCGTFATQQIVQRSTGRARWVLAIRYVRILNGTFKFQSHRPSRSNLTSLTPQQTLGLHIFSETADHKDLTGSVAITILRMNSSSRTIKDMFFMTPVDLRRAVRTS